MHFLIIMLLIGSFILFPAFRKVIGGLLTIVLVGMLVVYGPIVFINILSNVPLPIRALMPVVLLTLFMLGHYARVAEHKENEIYEGQDRPWREIEHEEIETFDYSKIETKYWGMAEEDWENKHEEAYYLRGLRSKLIAMENGNVERAKSIFLKTRVIQLQEEEVAIEKQLEKNQEYKFLNYIKMEGKVYAIITGASITCYLIFLMLYYAKR